MFIIIKKKALFLTLVVVLLTPLLLISRELPAKTYREDNIELKEKPSDEIKQQYDELQLEISQLEKETTLLPHLKNVQKKIDEISLEIKNIQPKIEPDTTKSRSKIKLTPASRALITKKRELQTELHTANIPIEALRDSLAAALIKKEKLESRYFLAPIEIRLLTETTSKLKGPIIIIESNLELKYPGDIYITLVLNRSVAASAFCELYLNNTFVNRKHWKIGSKGNFTTAIDDTHKAKPRQGQNNLTIVLNTSYQEDDVQTESPPFENNPLAIFNESTIASSSLISVSSKLKQTGGEKTPVEVEAQPTSNR